MRIHVLGSGTSTGVPVPGCDCAVCCSEEPRNKRLRTSILLEADTGAGTVNILVDATPDLRQQTLRVGYRDLDAVLFTHTHADHILGIDDLRVFCFRSKEALPAYASKTSAAELERLFYYAFNPDPNYVGGIPPNLDLRLMGPYEAIDVKGLEILPLPVMHGTLEVYGFRFGDFAYITDCSFIPEETREALSGIRTLVLDGLRERPHPTHFNHEQAVQEIELIAPERAYLTHITHDVDHYAANEKLAGMSKIPVELAYDGLVIEIGDGS